MALTRLQIFWRISFHWIYFSLIAAFITSLFSTFYPLDRLRSYYEFSFEWKSMEYFRYTMYFFTAISAAIAVPAFLANLAVYYRSRRIMQVSPKLFSIAVNTAAALLILAIYSTLGITQRQDLLMVMAPIYLVSVLISGFLFLPKL